MQFIDLKAQQQQRLADGRRLRDAIDGRKRRISRLGQSRGFFNTDVGVNARIDTLQTAIVLAKLEVFEAEVEACGRICAALSGKLQAAGINNTPQLVPGNTSVYAQFTIEVENRAAVQTSRK